MGDLYLMFYIIIPISLSVAGCYVYVSELRIVMIIFQYSETCL